MSGWLDPVYDASGMRAADRHAIEVAGIPSLELMDRAGRGLADAVALLAAGSSGPVRIVCGKGNNGGDGLVAARYLAERGFPVEVILLWPAAELSLDSRVCFEKLSGNGIFVGAEGLSRLPGSSVVVDAILGTGFEGSPRPPVSEAIGRINESGSPVVCCDLPSGVNGSTGEADEAVNGSRTVTFHGLKTGHLISPGKQLCGPVEVVDIGIPGSAPRGEASGRINSSVLGLLPQRGSSSNKFTSGRVSVVGGSQGLTGAVCLAADAAIRSGAGYASVAVPFDLEPIFEVKLTEVMSRGCGDTEGHLGRTAREEILEHCDEAAAVVLGSGMGRRKDTGRLIRSLTSRLKGPLVIDADGLGGLDRKLDRVREREGETILTPHAGEMSRMIGVTSSDVTAHRLESALELARESGAVVVLKGDDTIVTDGRRIAINELSAPGLATAGTGDVLAGICAGFLARGLEAFAAACAAVHCHARAGRIAAERAGSAEGVIAGDVITALPLAMSTGYVAAAPEDRGLE